MFGTLALPHVLNVEVETAREEIERTVPYRSIAYRLDAAALGRTVRIAGEIRETSISDACMQLERLRRLNDGLPRVFDFEDGTTTLNALLADHEYELSVGSWFSDSPYSPTGKFHVPYTVTLLEVA